MRKVVEDLICKVVKRLDLGMGLNQSQKYLRKANAINEPIAIRPKKGG